MSQLIKINDQEFNWNDLNENTKQLITALKITQSEIQRQNEIIFACKKTAEILSKRLENSILASKAGLN